ncbi:hypothetical protein SOVF_133500 [Spinacia oleracea]|uniref:LysM domain-containing protein n=1 Tax=Spinacia oleracea TaxID=3562 RepID=A0A9R0I3T7_SPIOL|nr:uncharacterized protein LOC110782288 [Spinacia oleracea]KNA11615.1 hypothetical protein SOVF_133500 [Spinacia oleracea]
MAPISPTQRRINGIRATLAIADTASWYCSLIIVGLILFITLREENYNPYYDDNDGSSFFSDSLQTATNGAGFLENHHHIWRPPCDEIYVVGEGETLHTISDKCGDPFIVERNPHIHDPDDVFPGLVIKIVPSSDSSGNINRKFLR